MIQKILVQKRASRRRNFSAARAGMSSGPDSGRGASISSALASTATLGCSVRARLNHPSGGRPASASCAPISIGNHLLWPAKSRSAAGVVVRGG